jgi:hypothetical protein
MVEYNEARVVDVENKIYRLKDIRSLVEILWNEYKSDQENGYDPEFAISIYFEDISLYRSEHIEILDEEYILSKKVDKIAAVYRNSDLDRTIDIEITHGDRTKDNRIIVIGKDTNWVNGRLSKVKTVINGITPQISFLNRYRKIIHPIISINIGFLFIKVLNVFIITGNNENSELITDNQFALWVIRLPLYYFLGVVAAEYLYKKAEILWPSVDIQIGPEHTLKSKKLKKIMKFVVLVLLIPLILQIIYDQIIVKFI